MTSRNHPNPVSLFPSMKRHEVLLLAWCEKGWTEPSYLLGDRGPDIDQALLEQWTENGLVETRYRPGSAGEYRATRSGKFVVKGWREAGWIE